MSSAATSSDIRHVGRAIRVQAAANADEAWWAEHRRRRAANHVSLMLAGQSLLNNPHNPAARERMRAAQAEYRAIDADLEARLGSRSRSAA